MADKLQEHLVNIETALGGTGELPSDDSDKLEWHLTKIESLIEGGGGSGVEDVKVNGESVLEDKVANINLKTINENSISGEGDIHIPLVEANPVLSGDEASLAGLKVNGTLYKVGEDQKYLHTVGFYFYAGNSVTGGYIAVHVINNTSTTFNTNRFITWLKTQPNQRVQAEPISGDMRIENNTLKFSNIPSFAYVRLTPSGTSLLVNYSYDTHIVSFSTDGSSISLSDSSTGQGGETSNITLTGDIVTPL